MQRSGSSGLERVRKDNGYASDAHADRDMNRRESPGRRARAHAFCAAVSRVNFEFIVDLSNPS